MSSSNRPARRKLTASDENIRVGSPPEDNNETPSQKSDKEVNEETTATPPNGGAQVPTQVGTTPGTQVGRKEEEDQEDQRSDRLEFSLRSLLATEKDPEQDWVKTGWQGKKYRKAAVDTAVKIKWRGFTERQDLVDAALEAFLPKELSDEAREMARRGEI